MAHRGRLNVLVNSLGKLPADTPPVVAADAPPDDLQLVGRFTGLSFEVADIDAVYDTLRGRGVVFAASPERQGWGGTVATLRDPAGNELQIYAWSRA
jgi:uncharacterized glyoxalase superfamily protein PhnB